MERVIIDTDPGFDDAMAIFLAASVPEKISIEALTTVNGNTDIHNATPNAFTILKICEREDIPVYRGRSEPLSRKAVSCESSHGDDGLGNIEVDKAEILLQKETAEEYMVRAAEENKGMLTLMPIGPLTNIAGAVLKDENFAKNIKKVVLMGGAEHCGNMSPTAEFNFWFDPEAAKIVFEAGFKEIVMIGLDVTRKAFMTPAMRELLYQINTPISRFIHQITRIYVDSYWSKLRNLGCELCDVLVSAFLIDESVLKLREAFVEIETDGICSGTSVVFPIDIWKEKKKNCKVAYDLDVKAFFKLFFEKQFPDFKEDAKALIEYEYRT